MGGLLPSRPLPPPANRAQRRPALPTLGGPTLAGGVQIAAPQRRTARRPDGPGPRLGAKREGDGAATPAGNRRGRGGATRPPPYGAALRPRAPTRGKTWAQPRRTKGKAAKRPQGLALPFARAAQAPAPLPRRGLRQHEARARACRPPDRRRRRAAAQAAPTAGAGRAHARMVARATDFKFRAPPRNAGRAGVPGAGCAGGAGRPLLGAAVWQQRSAIEGRAREGPGRRTARAFPFGQ